MKIPNPRRESKVLGGYGKSFGVTKFGEKYVCLGFWAAL